MPDERSENQSLFEVKYETPGDYKGLADELKDRFKLPTPDETTFLERLPDDQSCLQVAVCLRVTASSNEEYMDASFLPEMKKYFDLVRNPKARDFEARVAYFLLGTVADREEGIWKRKYTDEEARIRTRAMAGVEGEEIPQGESFDNYGIGEVPKDLVEYAKKVLLDHLETTESWEDLHDVDDLLTRVMEWFQFDSETDSCYLQSADSPPFIEAIEKNRERLLAVGGKEMKDECDRFDGLKKVFEDWIESKKGES